MFSLIFTALKAILPELIKCAPAGISTIKEILDSKKAVVTAGAIAAIGAQAGHTTAQIVTGAVAAAYTVVQGFLDHAAAKANAAT
jgi:hypothetical protein